MTKSGEPFKLRGREQGPWYGWSYDAPSRRWRRRSTGLTVLQAARSVARRWLQEGELVASGAAPAHMLASGLGLPQHLTDFVVERRRDPRRISGKHLDSVRMKLDRVAAIAGWKRLEDVTVDSALLALETMQDPASSRAQQAAGTRTPKALTPSALNGYRAALKAFTRWAHLSGRLQSDPLAKLRKWAVTGHESYERRPFVVDEIAHLLVGARRSAAVRSRLVGEDRAMLYLFALSTGFRWSECMSIRPRDFRLDARTPHVELSAAASKDGKPYQQALVPRGLPTLAIVVDELRRWLTGRPAGSPCWSAAGRGAQMIRADLAEAGVTIAASEGDRIDFHCLRGTLGRWLADALVAPAVAQRVLRHSTVLLTMKHYTHLKIEDLSLRDDGEPVVASPFASSPAAGSSSESASIKGTDHHCDGVEVCAQCARGVVAPETLADVGGVDPLQEGRMSTGTMCTQDSAQRGVVDVDGRSCTLVDVDGMAPVGFEPTHPEGGSRILSPHDADLQSAGGTGVARDANGDCAPSVRAPVAGGEERRDEPDGTRLHARDRVAIGRQPDLGLAIRRVQELAALKGGAR